MIHNDRLAVDAGVLEAGAVGIPVENWERSRTTHPRVVAYPTRVEDIVQILTRPDCYPSPVRAIGSTHSTTGCGVADGGTLVDMTGMCRIIGIGNDTVTAEAGALYIDVADALRRRNLQFFVNVEIGNLTLAAPPAAARRKHRSGASSGRSAPTSWPSSS